MTMENEENCGRNHPIVCSVKSVKDVETKSKRWKVAERVQQCAVLK